MRRLAAMAVLAVSVGLAAAPTAWPRPLQDTIDTTRQTLDRLKRTIEKTRQQRDRSKKEHGAILQSIERLDRRLHRERGEAAAIEKDITRLDRRLATIRAQLIDLRARMDDRKAMLAARIRRLYMTGRGGWFLPLLTADSRTRLQRRVVYLSALAAWERRWLDAHRRDRERLEGLHAQQESARKALATRKRRVDKALRTMKDVKARKKAVLSDFDQRTASQEQRLDALTRSEKQKEALLNALRQQHRVPASGRRAPAPFKKGALLWPTEGKLVGDFGRQKHPTFDTYVENKGIEIAVREGMPIRAVSAGDVMYADWLKGYGLVVILDHGSNYFTFYANASGLLVKKGDRVDRGAVLGKTGASGLTDRVVLYFELRKGTKPVNPLGWFAKR